MDVSRYTKSVRTTSYDELRGGEERLRRKLEGSRTRGDGVNLEADGRGSDQRGECRGNGPSDRARHLDARQITAHATVERHGHWPQKEPNRHQHHPHDHPLAHDEPTLGDATRPIKDSIEARVRAGRSSIQDEQQVRTRFT